MVNMYILEYIAFGVAIVGIVLIVWGLIKGLVNLARARSFSFNVSDHKTKAIREIRYNIGFNLLLGLEFLIAADIIRTIIEPSLRELAILGGYRWYKDSDKLFPEQGNKSS